MTVYLTEDKRKRWTEALRSGEYQQGRGQLMTSYQGDKLFCCLGVLADLEGRQELFVDYEVEWWGRQELFVDYEVGWCEACTLPTSMLSRETQGILIQANDGARNTFAEIADIIDSLPESAFEVNRWRPKAWGMVDE